MMVTNKANRLMMLDFSKKILLVLIVHTHLVGSKKVIGKQTERNVRRTDRKRPSVRPSFVRADFAKNQSKKPSAAASSSSIWQQLKQGTSIFSLPSKQDVSLTRRRRYSF